MWDYSPKCSKPKVLIRKRGRGRRNIWLQMEGVTVQSLSQCDSTLNLCQIVIASTGTERPSVYCNQHTVTVWLQNRTSQTSCVHQSFVLLQTVTCTSSLLHYEMKYFFENKCYGIAYRIKSSSKTLVTKKYFKVPSNPVLHLYGSTVNSLHQQH